MTSSLRDKIRSLDDVKQYSIRVKGVYKVTQIGHKDRNLATTKAFKIWCLNQVNKEQEKSITKTMRCKILN